MRMNRRKFLYSIAGGTAAIAGWVLIPGFTDLPISKRRSDDPFCPGLAGQIAFRTTPRGGEVMRADDQGVEQVVCEVNEFGLSIVRNLNGKNTLQDLARELHAGFDPEHLGHTEASVASFLAILAQAGVLSEPFFVNLHASEVTA